jgi:uncharacterized protein YbjT (DUF2867 family)
VSGDDELKLFLYRRHSPFRAVDDRLTFEVHQAKRGSTGELVGAGEAGDLGIAADRDSSESRVVEGTSEIPDVSPTVPEGRILFPPGKVEQFDLDVGMGEREASHGLRDVEPGSEGDDQAFDAPVNLVNASDDGIDGGEHSSRLFLEQLASGSELHTAGRPIEKLAAEILFQRTDLPAEDGLSDVELLCRPTKMPMLSHRSEVAKLSQVKIHARRVSIVEKRYWTPLGRPLRMRRMIVITAPTGDIGSQVLHALLENATPGNEELRVIARDPAKLSIQVRERVDVVTGSHGDADVVNRAFVGADAIFWLVPPDPAALSLEDAFSGFTEPAASAFSSHQVGHVVGISALGRGTAVAGRAGLVTASLAMDDLIASTGVAYRALANPSFMDNALRWVQQIRDHGVFTNTFAPDRKAPTTATRDIAAVAARLLLDRSWTGVEAVPVLGPEDLSHDDMARIMSEVLGLPVRYQRESLDELAARLTGYGMGGAFVQGMVDMMRAKEGGLDDGVARTAETVTPTSFRQWCEEVLMPAVCP